MKKDSNRLWEKFIECSCHTEGIMVSVEYFDDLPEPIVDLAFWSEGFAGRNLTFNNKLRLIWRILTKGRPWHDMIMLDKESAIELADHLYKVFENKEIK